MSDPSTPIVQLKNVGPKGREWLASLELETLGDIERMGIPAIYHALKAQGRPVSANLLYALQGALLGIHWQDVPEEMKADLRRAVATKDGT